MQDVCYAALQGAATHRLRIASLSPLQVYHLPSILCVHLEVEAPGKHLFLKENFL